MADSFQDRQIQEAIERRNNFIRSEERGNVLTPPLTEESKAKRRAQVPKILGKLVAIKNEIYPHMDPRKMNARVGVPQTLVVPKLLGTPKVKPVWDYPSECYIGGAWLLRNFPAHRYLQMVFESQGYRGNVTTTVVPTTTGISNGTGITRDGRLFGFKDAIDDTGKTVYGERTYIVDPLKCDFDKVYTISLRDVPEEYDPEDDAKMPELLTCWRDDLLEYV